METPDRTGGFAVRYHSPQGWRIYRHGELWDETYYDAEREAVDALALRRPQEATELYKRFRN